MCNSKLLPLRSESTISFVTIHYSVWGKNGYYSGLVSLGLFVTLQTTITPSLFKASSSPLVSTIYLLLFLLQAETITGKIQEIWQKFEFPNKKEIQTKQ